MTDYSYVLKNILDAIAGIGGVESLMPKGVEHGDQSS